MDGKRRKQMFLLCIQTYLAVTGNHVKKALGIVDLLKNCEALSSLSLVVWFFEVISSEQEPVQMEAPS